MKFPCRTLYWCLAALPLAAVAIVVLRPAWRAPSAGAPSTHSVAPDEKAGRQAGTPGFRDVAPEAGIDFQMSFLPKEQGEHFKVNLYDHGCGVAVADYDGDGGDDVFFLNQLGPNALYRNRGDGTFENVTDEAGPLALADRVCVGAAFGDYDNDGDQDLYVTSTRGGNVLFENGGTGRFRDVTDAAGVTCVAHSQTPAWFDYDLDGDLDLFVTNTARWTRDEFDASARYFPGEGDIWDRVFHSEDRESNRLYRNNGDGAFSDVTAQAGLEGDGWGGDVAVFDFDEDGDLDLFVTNMFGMSQLNRNDGRGHFDDVTRATLHRTSMGAIGSKAFDFDGDGRLDLFIADMHSDMWVEFDAPQRVQPGRKFSHFKGPDVDFDLAKLQREQVIADQLKLVYDHLLFGNSLFRNQGAGKFRECSDAAGLETWWPWGVAVGDFDNDGGEDLLLPAGMGFPFFYWPASLMHNNGNGTFADVASEQGIEPPRLGRFLPQTIRGQPAVRSSRCAATADFDGDGRIEIVVSNFNDRPYYFKNQFPPRHYVAFRLRGTQSDRDAIGALVKLWFGERVLVRQVQAAGGYLSQSSKTLHFGLGDLDQVDRAEVHWPSGRREVIPSPAVDRLHEVTEGG